ncbi:hypothetical protein NKR23_g10283 [Pleurostoma richardsiae]|uniref:Uncharacterized protein n=1 Tax=Pleurostoma richardsiae TaxID=41990 RepID=A0AA38RKL0_9PEZI|nr:hypothetical protein NKR23_g10283 [Pleurostoma richardsiae]
MGSVGRWLSGYRRRPIATTNGRTAAGQLKPRLEINYPQTDFFMGPEAPCRFEPEVYDCIVRGEILEKINGTCYYLMPDPLQAPLYDDIDAVRINDGHAEFK